MNKKEILDRRLDAAGLALIGIAFSGYLLFARVFAEKHISLPFLDFPIFTGEILLFICSIILCCKWLNNPPQFNRYYKILSLYIGFLLFKAFVLGYFNGHGPLALRHAALFYYPLFSVFGFVFYRRDFFNRRIIISFISAFLLVFVLLKLGLFPFFYSYGVFTFFCLLLLLLYCFPDRKIAAVFFIISLFFIPYRLFFYASRTTLVSNAFAVAYLAAGFSIIAPFKKAHKVGILLAGVIIITLGLSRISDANAIRSLGKINRLFEGFNQIDAGIANYKDYRMKEIKTLKLYNPEEGIVFGWGAIETNVSLPSIKAVEFFKNDTKEGETLIALNPVTAVSAKPKLPKAALTKTALPSSDTIEPEAVLSVQELQKKVEEAKAVVDVLSVKTDNVKTKIQDTDFDTEAAQREWGKARSRALEVYSVLVSIASVWPQAEPAAPVTVKLAEEDKKPAPKVQVKKQAAKYKEPVKEQHYDLLKKELLDAQGRFEQITGELEGMLAKIREAGRVRNTIVLDVNAYFRMFIWRDMLRELFEKKAFFGIDFGKPLRSRSLEMLNWANDEWERDGWVEPHNSYLNIIYRAGVVGVAFVACLFFIIFKMALRAIKIKSVPGLLICTVLINWFTAANFLVILELPYNAIFFWSFLGMALAYFYKYSPPERKEKRFSRA